MESTLVFLASAVQGLIDSSNMFISLVFSGAMIPPLINGFLMEKDYHYYLLSVIISQAVCVISFAGIWLLGKHILSNSRLPNLDSVENKPLSLNE